MNNIFNTTLENENNWEEFKTNTTIEDTLVIIDEALSFLFEFKVENHKLYFRQA